jgi:hypothetical protein
MLTREEANILLNKLTAVWAVQSSRNKYLIDCVNEFTEKSEMSTQDNTKRALQIVIDVVGYMNDEHKWGHYNNFNVQKSLEAAEELLENKNVNERRSYQF